MFRKEVITVRNIKLLFVIASIAVILIVLALVASGCGTTFVKKETIDALNSDKIALQEQITTLKRQLAVCKVETEKAYLSSKIDALEKQLEDKPDD